MPNKAIEERGAALTFVATFNGRARYPLFAFRPSDTRTPILSVTTNLSDEHERAKILPALPDDARDEAGAMLLRLAAAVESERAARPRRAVEGTADASVPPEFSEDALALEFARRHGGEHRYTAAWAQWHRYAGARWERDETLRVFELARAVCRDAATRAPEPRVGTILSSAKTVAAVERLARSDRRVAASSEQWDSNRWLLNTPGLTIDLRSAQGRAPRPADYITRCTAVRPGGDCPRWEEFIKTATDGDEELIGFLRRLFGYCLTGDVSEHALIFIHGRGANGKSTCVATVQGIFADYAVTSPVEAFTEARGGDRHPTELARLRGARLVTAQETEQGRPWAESRIKMLTGGDPVPARFMRGDFFTFEPEFKLLIAGNHRPRLRTIDEAIRRRLYLIPFDKTVPPEKRDPQLREKLRAEWPGILQWMIDGCQEWLERGGLHAPSRVRVATDAYLEQEDSFGAWMDECCATKDAQAETSSAELYLSWKGWAERAGELPGSAKRFAEQLQSRGFESKRIGHRQLRGFRGIALRA